MRELIYISLLAGFASGARLNRVILVLQIVDAKVLSLVRVHTRSALQLVPRNCGVANNRTIVFLR
jgi:hypothetical protein